jgi:hypothetical protein
MWALLGIGRAARVPDYWYAATPLKARPFHLDLTRASLFHWLQRKSVFTLKVNAAFTVRRVLTRSMFNMIFGVVI